MYHQQQGNVEKLTYSHYAASKGGIISFTKSLASEFGQYNINVNCVAPGWVLTNMSEKTLSNKKTFEEEIKKIPLRRIASADDIAGPVLFLASESIKACKW
jgi:NAD(P)-dependent dehydrogenase (short-subunit alcohol dehydrogenase family)